MKEDVGTTMPSCCAAVAGLLLAATWSWPVVPSQSEPGATVRALLSMRTPDQPRATHMVAHTAGTAWGLGNVSALSGGSKRVECGGGGKKGAEKPKKEMKKGVALVAQEARERK